LFLIWFLVVTGKYLSRKVGYVDDIRQYLEIVYPVCLIASSGGYYIFREIKKRFKKLSFFVFLGITGIYGILQIMPVAGYETSYFNELIGGIGGAEGKMDIEFWGESMKEAGGWLSDNGKKGSLVYTPLAGHLLKYYIRDDMRVKEAGYRMGGKEEIVGCDYIVILNRMSFFDIYDPYIPYYLEKKKVLYEVKRDGATLLWILKN